MIGAPEEPPPILGSWRKLYALLVVQLCALIAACWLLGRWAA